MKEKIYTILPHFMQNLFVTFYNILRYKNRYGGIYKKARLEYQQNRSLTLKELQKLQLEKLKSFLLYVREHSAYYKDILKALDIQNINKVDDIKELPLLTKDIIREKLPQIATLSSKQGIVSKTGGTTGTSMKVIFTHEDIQKRFAFVENFRSRYGYELGKKTAWFTGKNFLVPHDLKKNRFWKTDHYYNVRYYSTYHINNKSITYYLKDLASFQPEYLIGFPSNMYDIAKFGLDNKLNIPSSVKAIFPTAETITEDMRKTITSFFKTKIFDQYGASEGAPFIFECEKGNYHMELQSGIFEFFDSGKGEKIKRMVVTSFQTNGTPLIRYDIGDEVKLTNNKCNCGNNNPIVEQVIGRESDFLYSEETGKINLGNISNCTKGVNGIKKFQAIQDDKEEIKILIAKDNDLYKQDDEKLFIENLRQRLGHKIKLTINYIDDISKERSGKYRIVKNNIKHLLD